MDCGTGSLWRFTLIVASICATKGKVIVYPRMLQSRSDDSVKILKINEDITLNLRKSSVFSEEIFVHTTKDGEPISYHMHGAELEKTLYDDSDQMAAVHVTEEDGLSVEGVLGDTLRIKPLEGMERSLDGRIAHELYEIPDQEIKKLLNTEYSMPPNITAENYGVEARIDWYKAPRLPLRIRPEVHVVFDYFISKALGFIEKKVARYVAILTASANLRYRSIVQPRVQLAITGITVTKTLEEEPYMVHVPGYEATRNILHVETRAKFNEHVKKQTYFDKTDIVFLVTGLNLSEWEGSTLQHWVGGSAYLGAVCTQWKVGLSEERVGSFYGVYVFAHEIAHSLGCAHDGEDAYKWPYGHIGSKDCDWNIGYIMSYAFKKPYLYQFSPCCQREIMNFYNRPEYGCLLVKNSIKTGIFSTKLPGSVSSRQVYCEKVYYGYTHVKVDRSYKGQVCMVKCIVNREGESWYISAVDGVTCGHKKICVLGNCTSKAELKKAE
ncbi:venom metalloproteinase BumaMPs1-like isoform X1 [Rhipicephalus microplus]|uniref:venom metalloproteinase BumaMPs1-like isoform X1 n=1 Tax=Rhipicephalus microplus TaxID=6941 RepID=UPI003F6AE6AE